MSDQNAHIGEFVPGRGYPLFIPHYDVVAFRAYIVKANAHDREYYSLTSVAEPKNGGEVYYIGLHRTKNEMNQFLEQWILRMDQPKLALFVLRNG